MSHYARGLCLAGFPKYWMKQNNGDPRLQNWVSVKELNFQATIHLEETILFTIYTHYGNLV